MIRSPPSRSKILIKKKSRSFQKQQCRIALMPPPSVPIGQFAVGHELRAEDGTLWKVHATLRQCTKSRLPHKKVELSWQPCEGQNTQHLDDLLAVHAPCRGRHAGVDISGLIDESLPGLYKHVFVERELSPFPGKIFRAWLSSPFRSEYFDNPHDAAVCVARWLDEAPSPHALTPAHNQEDDGAGSAPSPAEEAESQLRRRERGEEEGGGGARGGG